MALYKRTIVDGQTTFSILSDKDEVSARSNTDNLFGNDSGHDYVLSAEEASEIKKLASDSDNVDEIFVSVKNTALIAIKNSDTTMLRLSEAVGLGKNSFSSDDAIEFINYRRSLRAIINGTDTSSTELPKKPPFPAGT